MKKFKVVWSIQLSKDIMAENLQEAVKIIEKKIIENEIFDGNYVEDSFSVLYAEVKGELCNKE